MKQRARKHTISQQRVIRQRRVKVASKKAREDFRKMLLELMQGNFKRTLIPSLAQKMLALGFKIKEELIKNAKNYIY